MLAGASAMEGDLGMVRMTTPKGKHNIQDQWKEGQYVAKS